MILGHKKQLSFLKKILESEKVPHAILFSGQEKLGKKKVAFEFASWILKENPLSHPDFILLEPKEQMLSIEKIRDLNYHLSLTPVRGKNKVAIIDDAHLMTIEAQNCFLKQLEEPTINTLLILISSFPEILLPTIRSRCQQIKFFPLKREEIERFLEDQKIPEKKELLKISQGRPGILFEILKKPQKLNLIEERKKILKNLPKMSVFEKFEFLKKVDNVYFLENLFFYFRKKYQEDLEEKEKALEILKSIEKTQLLLSVLKVDKRMAMENLILKI
jgi:DNA polymerase-3 subunit delta'